MKLSKEQTDKRDEIVLRLGDKAQALIDAAEDLNSKIADLFGSYTAALEEYNAVVRDAEEFRSEVATDLRSQYDEKSDRWRDGENGQKADTFISEWENVELSEEDEPDAPEVEVPDPAHSAELEGLPSED